VSEPCLVAGGAAGIGWHLDDAFWGGVGGDSEVSLIAGVMEKACTKGPVVGNEYCAEP
jgi:hypothetical protein